MRPAKVRKDYTHAPGAPWKLVRVDWEDAESAAGWNPTPPAPMKVSSAGWLKVIDEEKIVLAQSVSDHLDTADELALGWGMVLNVFFCDEVVSF